MTEHPSNTGTQHTDDYSRQFSEFQDIAYDKSAISNNKKLKFIPDFLLNPKILAIIFSFFYVQSLLITYYILNEKYSKCPYTRKIKIGQFLLSSFYLTIATILYLFLFYILLRKLVF